MPDTGIRIENLTHVPLFVEALGEDDAFSRGYSASGIIINKHAAEVTLVLESGEGMTVAEAINKYNKAREKAQA